MISRSWGFLNEIIFIRSKSTVIRTFFERKRITAMLLVEKASKHYYMTNEIMKRWYLFDIVFLLKGYVFCSIKNSIFLSIFCCFYLDFTGLSKKCWRKHILKEWLRVTYLLLQISSRHEVFYIRLRGNNENQCFSYSFLKVSAIEILKSAQKLITKRYIDVFQGLSRVLPLVSNKISYVILNFDQLIVLAILRKK